MAAVNSTMRVAVTGAAALCAALCLRPAGAAEPLQPFGADLAQTSVSGVSSGGYMAVQFHVAYSSLVIGAGVLAGGPYYCAQGSVLTAYLNCMTPRDLWRLPAPEVLADIARNLGNTGLIDPTTELARARVWLFTGTEDRTIAPLVTEGTRRFYRAFVPAAQIAVVKNVPAGHAMVTAGAGAACSATKTPFINNCKFDAAGTLLAHLYGPLAAPGEAGGKLVAFDQNEFAGGDAYAASLAATGYLWVPEACAQARCRVHIAFHGCRQNAEAVGEAFVRDAGYNRWASTNRLLVLYPQTIARTGWGRSVRGMTTVFNPRGCWDWWGYTGVDYHLKRGAQMRAVRAMLQRVATAPAAR